MVRYIAILTVALFTAAPSVADEMDSEFGAKSPVNATKSLQPLNPAADLDMKPGKSEMDNESPTQSRRRGWGWGWGGGWGHGWRGGWGGWNGGWGWGGGWNRGWGWGGWNGGWGWGGGWNRGWGWGGGWNRGWGWGGGWNVWPSYSFWAPSVSFGYPAFYGNSGWGCW